MNTSWIDHLQHQGFRLTAQSHALAHTDEREATSLAASSTILVPLTHLGLIGVTGEEATVFLHNLTSNDIKKLGPDQAHHNSLSGPKGRMLANFLVWRSGGDFRLALAADLHAALFKKLGMYVLRAKVKLTDGNNERALIGIAGPLAADFLRLLGVNPPPAPLATSRVGNVGIVGLDQARYIIDSPIDQAPALWDALCHAGAIPAGTAAWQWLDIRAGLPLISSLTQDEFVAQMINFELLGGVNFQKGCFPGQEIIARTQHLGKVKKRMFLAHVSGTTEVFSGTDLFAPEFGTQSCGKVVNAAASPEEGHDLLAVMQLSAREAGDVHLGAPDGKPLTFADLPYPVD